MQKQPFVSFMTPLLVLLFLISAHGDLTTWQGYRQENFEVDGRSCVLILPEASAPGNPWLLRANPVGLDSSVDKALLRHGFHIAYMDVEDLHGNAKAIGLWDNFHARMVADKGLAAKPVLTGKAHGALLLHAWAATHPEQTACILAETPWLRLDDRLKEGLQQKGLETLWTRLTGAGPGSLSFEEQAVSLGEARLPILHLCDDNDPIAPAKDHSKALYEQYRRAGRGGVFEIVYTPSDARPSHRDMLPAILYFVLKHAGRLASVPPGEALPTMPDWTPADFAGRTEVYVLDDALIIEEGNDMTGISWTGPVPEGDYEITLEAMRISGGDFFCGLTAPYKDTVFSLVVGGWGGTCVGISSLDWLDAYHNETARFRSFEEQRWYRIRLHVSDGLIEAWIDEEQVVDVDITNREVDIRWEMAPTKPLGIATWRTTGAIRNFQIRQFQPALFDM